MTPIGDLNELPRAEFIAALRPLFEAADPLADALYARRPFASYDALLDEAESAAQQLSLWQQIEVVNAHPRIGATASTMSELSRREQGAAQAEVDAQLRVLNEQYETRFGHRFVVFVKRRPRAEILRVLQRRIQNRPEDELRTALHDLLEIARDRLHSFS